MTIKKILTLLFLSIGLLLVSSCKNDENIINNGCTITGEGAVLTKTLNLSDFNKIQLSISGNVTITQGTTQSVDVIGQTNIIDGLNTNVTNNTWNIGFNGNCGYSYNDLTINITVPNIHQVKISGSGNVTINDFTNQSELALNISGSGYISLNNFEGITDLSTVISGSGNVTANKDISTLTSSTINISGSGKYKGYVLSSDTGSVRVSGSGLVEITVNNTLDATVSGSGNLYYKGTPTVTQNITGSGQLIDAN